MDGTEVDGWYPRDSYGSNYQSGYTSRKYQNLLVRNAPYQYVHNEGDDDDEVDEEEESESESPGKEAGGNNKYNVIHHMDMTDYDEDDDEGDKARTKYYKKRIEDSDFERHPKKRKLKNLIPNYELVPRDRAPSLSVASAPKPLHGGRSSVTDWTEHETFVLLDAWGSRFIHHGRKSLKFEEWHDVAERVSKESKMERTDVQCRNRLDTLKKKYKKEMMKLLEISGTSKWVYFKKMDRLMSFSSGRVGLPCGFDFGESAFKNPRRSAREFDEMGDSLGNSISADGKEDESYGFPPKSTRSRKDVVDGSSLNLLAEAINNFCEIYEEIEERKRQQMEELEKMRMDFLGELEMQRKQILETAKAAIVQIREGDY